MFGIKTKLLEILNEYIGPVDISISPVPFRCNHFCRMCWRRPYWKNNKVLDDKYNIELDIEIYRKMIRNLPFTVKSMEIVGGGEPLLYKDIDVLFSEIKKKKLEGKLLTNGSFLDKHIDLLGKISWDEIKISINAATKDTYKYINGADSFDKVIENIKKIKSSKKNKKIKLVLSYVVQKGNYFEVDKMIDLSKSLGVDEILFFYVTVSNKDVDGAKELLLNDKEWKILEKKMSNLSDKCNIKNNINVFLSMRKKHENWNNKDNKNNNYLIKNTCTIIKKSLYIKGDGNAVLCNLSDRKIFDLNIKNKSIGSIWRSYAKYRKMVYAKKYFWFCKEYCNYQIS